MSARTVFFALGWLLLPWTVEAGEPSPARRVARLPLQAVNLAADHQSSLETLFVERLQRLGTLELTHDKALDLPGTCVEQPSCLKRAAREQRAALLVALRAGRLGETLMLRLAVFEGQDGTRSGTWQEVLQTPDRRAITAALDRMITGFAPRPEPPRPWYSRWWVWTAAGVVIAGTVTAVLLSTRDSGSKPPITIPAP